MADSSQIRVTIQLYFDDEIADGVAIEADTDCFENGLLDSLGLVSLIGYVETHFDIEVGQEDFEMSNFASVDAVTRLVSGYVEQTAGHPPA